MKTNVLFCKEHKQKLILTSHKFFHLKFFPLGPSPPHTTGNSFVQGSSPDVGSHSHLDNKVASHCRSVVARTD